MVKVSVIVPVYNVEEYLRDCMDSLIGQTFDDIEIICVDDGSSDSSLDILKEYEKNDARINVITQENKGLSGARNTGMKYVTGEYVYFMDSDDKLIPTSIMRMYNAAKSRDLDILIFKIINFDDETNETTETKYYEMDFLKEEVNGGIFSHRDIPDILFRIAVTMSSKLFRRELIQDMQFIEGLIFEDNPYFIEAMLKAERVYFLDEHLYYKRVRSGSITTSPNKQFFDYITIANILIDICKEYGVYEDYKEGLYSKTLGNIFFRFTQVPDEYKDEYFQKIKDDFASKKEEYDADEVFQNGYERNREIFYGGLDLATPLEYELTIKLFDAEERFQRLKKDKTQTNQDRIKFLKRAHKAEDKNEELKAKNRELGRENRKLIRQNEKLKKQNESLNNLNEEILNSTSWKVTEPLRKVTAKVKK